MAGFRRNGAGRKGLFLVLFFLLFWRVSSVFFWNAERETKRTGELGDWLFHQAERLSWNFWYPGIRSESEENGKNAAGNGRRIEDPDPSYAHYIEGKQQRQEYQQFRSVLRENSRLFAGLFGEARQTGQKQEKQSNSALPLGTVAGDVLLQKNPAFGGSEGGRTYFKEQLADYDFLIKHFYTVHPTAAAGRDLMRADVFLETDLSLEKAENGEPQILIYHTHSQETYADYDTGNPDANVITVGEHLAECLRRKGYGVIHDTSFYDLQGGELDRSRAYNYALEGISGMLQNYPSIQVILDVHRDGVSEHTHLISEVNGKQTAKVMFFNGTSETPDGPIAYLPNPCRTENLAFSFQLKLCADALYPGFTRNIYLKGLRYNQHLRPRSALLEVGAQTNTLEEALNAMEPLAELLELVLGKG